VEVTPWSGLGRDRFGMSLQSDPSRGGVWVGFWQGGVAYFKDGRVRATYEVSDGLGGGYVGTLMLDGEGTGWAATQGGLSRMRDGKVVTLTASNGLPCDAVQWAIQGDTHSLWLGTVCGVVRIARDELDRWVADPKRHVAVAVFDSTDGIRSVSPSAF